MSDAEAFRVWEQLQARAERLLEHPKDLPPRDPIRLYNSLWRFWQYQTFGAQTTWTVLLPGRKAPRGAPPLAREVAWDMSGDNLRVLNLPLSPEGRKTDPHPSIRVRDAYLPPADLQRLLDAGTGLSVPLLASARAADAEEDLFGLETYEVSPFVRVQWRGAGPLPWRHFLDWVGEVRAFVLRHLDGAGGESP
jgi:hypothetical protein